MEKLFIVESGSKVELKKNKDDRLSLFKHTFQSHIHPNFNIASVPNGGYSIYLILKACLASLDQQLFPHPIAVSLTFARGCSVGKMEIITEDIKKSPNYAQLTFSLVQDGLERIRGTGVFGNLKNQSELKENMQAIQMPFMPQPDSTHVDWLQLHEFVGDGFPRFFDIKALRSVDTNGAAVLTSWIRPKDKNVKLDLAFVGFTMDSNPPALLSLSGDYESFYYPTLAMTIHFYDVPPTNESETDYLLFRHQCIVNRTGRHEERSEAFTKDGKLIATATQYAIAATWEKNQKISKPNL